MVPLPYAARRAFGKAVEKPNSNLSGVQIAAITYSWRSSKSWISMMTGTRKCCSGIARFLTSRNVFH
jgi:hypothetical protein